MSRERCDIRVMMVEVMDGNLVERWGTCTIKEEKDQASNIGRVLVGPRTYSPLYVEVKKGRHGAHELG